MHLLSLALPSALKTAVRLPARAGLALLLSFTGMSACSREAATESEPAAAAVVQTAAPTEQAPPQLLSRDRIYYDLTRFGWYARGEPLLHEERSYQPAGTPLSAPLEEMERAGEYDGVEYYRRAGDDERLYVPVFDGYWLAFRPVDTALRAD